MDIDSLLQRSQETITCPSTKPDESIARPPSLSDVRSDGRTLFPV